MASITAFKPHGLIKTPAQEQLYFRAHIANVYAGIADPKEHETVALVEVLYNKTIFYEDYFMVNSQWPLAPTSDRRCDIAVRYLESGNKNIRIFDICECKRARTSQAFSLKALEKQAFEYSQLYLNCEKDVTFVYCSTWAGAHVRLWRAELGSWAPLWGRESEGDDGGDWGQYKDVGDDVAGLELERLYKQIKQRPQKLYAGQNYDTYGMSYTTGASSASGFQAATQGYAVTPLYPPSGYTVSYSAPSASTSLPPVLASQTKPGVQPVRSTDVPFGEEAGESQEDEEDEEAGGDYQMGGDTETQQTSSSAEAKYNIVRVTKEAHTFKSDEFIFTDAKGKRRSTERTDWQKIKYKDKSAWMYRHYITYNLPK